MASDRTAAEYVREARSEFAQESRGVNDESIERLLCAIEALVADGERTERRIAGVEERQRLESESLASGIARVEREMEAARPMFVPAPPVASEVQTSVSTGPTPVAQPSACDERCVGTCLQHLGLHPFTHPRSVFACTDWTCDGTGPAHKARAPAPTTSAFALSAIEGRELVHLPAHTADRDVLDPLLLRALAALGAYKAQATAGQDSAGTPESATPAAVASSVAPAVAATGRCRCGSEALAAEKKGGA